MINDSLMMNNLLFLIFLSTIATGCTSRNKIFNDRNLHIFLLKELHRYITCEKNGKLVSSIPWLVSEDIWVSTAERYIKGDCINFVL